MDKISKLLLCEMPVYTCNLRCEYCYITNQKLWGNGFQKPNHSVEDIVKALSKERIGGYAFINLCGNGETLIPHESIELAYGWAKEGHYVEIVTNGTLTKRFEEIAEFPKDVLSNITFKFSFHYKELKDKNLLDVFFSNVWMIHVAGASFTVELTPYDSIENDKDEILKVCYENLGSACHLTIARDDMKNGIPVMSKKTFEDYCDAWDGFSEGMFDFKKEIFGIKREEFCYAGLNSLNIRLLNGDFSKCYSSPIIGNIFDNMDSPIDFKAIGHCPLPHCYNGHAHLTFGLVPSLNTPSYYYVRNIHLKDGTDSIKPKMKEVMEQKISENTEHLSAELEDKIYKQNKKAQITEVRKQKIKKIVKSIIKRK